MSRIDELADQAMTLHADDTPQAAALLEQAAALATEPTEAQADLNALLRACEHVLLGHLDDGARLVRLLDTLPSAAARARAAIALAAGTVPEPLSWQDLAPAEQVRAHYNAALALSRRRDFAGMRTLMRAAEALAGGDDVAPQQAWAAVANNIAGDMRFYHRAPDAPHADLMLEAATLARQAWQRAGGWLQVERADWQLAMCAAAAGRGEAALEAARACLAACEAHAGESTPEADDYEFCFAHQALALAALAAADAAQAQQARAQMAARIARLPEADRGYAQQCLAEIDAALAGQPGNSLTSA